MRRGFLEVRDDNVPAGVCEQSKMGTELLIQYSIRDEATPQLVCVVSL
jgi:hypothetical protein